VRIAFYDSKESKKPKKFKRAYGTASPPHGKLVPHLSVHSQVI